MVGAVPSALLSIAEGIFSGMVFQLRAHSAIFGTHYPHTIHMQWYRSKRTTAPTALPFGPHHFSGVGTTCKY